MTASISFRHTLVLPTVSRLHEALVAFYRSSECGAWQLDEASPQDEGRLRFVRGNWEEEAADVGRTGPRTPGFPDWAPQHGYVPHTIPMLLSVHVHVAPEASTVELEHTAYTRETVEEIEGFCETLVGSELKSLTKYLKICFNLPKTLELVRSDDPVESPVAH